MVQPISGDQAAITILDYPEATLFDQGGNPVDFITDNTGSNTTQQSGSDSGGLFGSNNDDGNAFWNPFGDSSSSPDFSLGETTDSGQQRYDLPPWNQNRFIVSGNLRTGAIDAETETVATPNNLAKIAENTDNPNYNGIFSPFPTGTQGTLGGGEGIETRNPLVVCQRRYGC